MFSSRLPIELRPNRLSGLCASKRQAGAAVLDLSESNPTRAGILAGIPAGSILGPLSDPRGLLYQPSPRGLPAARQAVARYYAERDLSVNPDRLLLCASTSEAYSWLFQLLCDVDERVLFPQPSYPLFEHLAGLCAVRLHPYPLDYDGEWRLDLPALRAACQPETRAVLLVNPNNPTGSFIRRGELAELLAICRERRLALVVDEVFSDYAFTPAGEAGGQTEGATGQAGDAAEERVHSLVELAEDSGVLCFVLSGLSKVLGLPQLKLGWIYLTGGPHGLRQKAQERLELIADTFLSVGTPVQWAAEALLGQRALLGGRIQQRVQENWQAVQGLVRGTACQVLFADGGWYAVLRLPRLMSEEEWVLRFLQDDDVLCHPGYFYDFAEEAYVILSLLPDPAVFQEAVGRIVRRVELA